MTTFNLISDLHLEVEPVPFNKGKVLILSGDVIELRNLDKPVGQRFLKECAKFDRIIYVLGNHEYYSSVFDEAQVRALALLPANVTLLQRDHTMINDVLVIGATLWTDCRKRDPLVMHTLGANMNDFHCIGKMLPGYVHPQVFRPGDSVDEFEKDFAYIKQVVESNPDKKIVVCTHHAPTELSLHPKYQTNPTNRLMNGGFASDLSEFILDNPQIKVWTHGHTHTSFNYAIGETRVLCNPKGYGDENPDFDLKFTFEV